MLVQLARLFGGNSTAARQCERSPAEWRHVLRKVVRELDHYVDENVTSDELHMMMLYSSLGAAEESLKSDDFWPGYAEGMTRLALLLMGDYPDHRRRQSGRKRTQHYALDLHRRLTYVQNETQRVRTLISVSTFGCPRLSRKVRDVLSDFRQRFGSRATYRQFLRWYRENYPEDYAAVF